MNYMTKVMSVTIKLRPSMIPNTGKMSIGGVFSGSTTYSGWPVDVVKSALQKYIRRNIPDKAEIAAFELFRMIEINNESNRGVALVSNLYNRLGVIATEDIGPANLPLVISVLNIVNTKNRDPIMLATIVQLMAMSEKTRIMSHLYHGFCHSDNRKSLVEMGYRVDDSIRFVDGPDELWKDGDPEEIKPYANMFYLRLKERDYNAFMWMKLYLDKAAEIHAKVKSRNRRTKPDIILWIILGYFLPKDVISVMTTSYFNMSENGPILTTAVTAVLFDESYLPIDLDPYYKSWIGHPSIDRLLHGQYDISFDNYVYDMHTSVGRKMGKNIKDFITEGSVVYPQSDKYYDHGLADLYAIR